VQGVQPPTVCELVAERGYWQVCGPNTIPTTLAKVAVNRLLEKLIKGLVRRRMTWCCIQKLWRQWRQSISWCLGSAYKSIAMILSPLSPRGGLQPSKRVLSRVPLSAALLRSDEKTF
jgi:hypothetical protein